MEDKSMNTNMTVSLRRLSQSDWLDFGLNDLAYLRPTVVDGQPVFAIHAADGSQLALATSRDVGVAAMRQHDLEPVSLQ
jgi:hypothetical protein